LQGPGFNAACDTAAARIPARAIVDSTVFRRSLTAGSIGLPGFRRFARRLIDFHEWMIPRFCQDLRTPVS